MTQLHARRSPPKPQRLCARYEVADDQMRITFRRILWAPGLFLLLWLTGWTVGCVVLANAVVERREWSMVLFGIPFWASWVFVAWLVTVMFLGVEDLEIDNQSLRYRWRALFPIKRRELPLAEIRRFAIGAKSSNSDSRSTDNCLKVHTVGKPLEVFAGLPESELQWLTHQLRQLLPEASQADDEPLDLMTSDRVPAEQFDEQMADEREPSRSDAAREQGDAEDGEDTDESRGADSTRAARRIVLPQKLARQPVSQPTDSDWRLSDDYNGLCFTQRGRWQWGGVLGLLFITCFWNGIVSVFVLGVLGVLPGKMPQGWERVGLAVFLIPFVVIGLGMFAALVLVVFEPVRRLVWRFGDREIECRLSWLGIGRSWNYPVSKLGRLEICATDQAKPLKFKQHFGARDASEDDDSWKRRLVFVGSDNRELCEIVDLTEGEARWIADRIQRNRSKWFR